MAFLLICGCDENGVRVLLVMPSSLDGSYETVKRAALEWAADRNILVDVIAPSYPSAAGQQGVLEQALSKRWDVICIQPLGDTELSPLLEYARDGGSVVVTVRGGDFPAASYNIEPFSAPEMGGRMMDALGGAMNERGMFITMLPSTQDGRMLEIETAAVSKQKQNYAAMFAASRLEETRDRPERARELLLQAYEKYEIAGVLFFSTNDGLGIASSELGDQRPAAVGIGDIGRLGAAVENGNIDALFYWDGANLVLAAMEVGLGAAGGKDYGGQEVIVLGLEGYETLRRAQGNTWVANDIKAVTSKSK